MRKKYFLIFLFAYCQLHTANFAFGQFFQGIGITGGVTLAKHKWILDNPDGSSTTLTKKNKFGFNGSVRAEFINSENIRWVTEIQFNQKGCRDKTDSAMFKNRLNYLCWNNFLKLQYETYSGFPYILFGPRVEYLLSQKIQSPPIVGAFKKFSFSWSVGVGYEKIVYGRFKPFIEVHYNPDFNFRYAYEVDPLNIHNRAWEFRIGVIYRPGRDECPGVVY